MNATADTLPVRPPLAPWLQRQLESLLKQQGHAWILGGPSGLGQFELALAAARAWLCDEPTPQGACNHCASCHAVDVHTHADLCVLMPETLSLALGWPLDEKTQDDLDAKKRKPSKEIKVDAAREVVAFTQSTRSRGTTKVVLVFPAERMNHITANTLLKTLEEPPGAVRFILATEAAHQLLPTIRSRCISHAMVWPDFDQAMAWLQKETAALPAGEGTGKSAARAPKPADAGDLHTLLLASGGRPADALAWARETPTGEAARHWQALPGAMARGDVGALANWTPGEAVVALQKLCHDTLAVRMGAAPRFFSSRDIAAAAPDASRASAGKAPGIRGMEGLAQWAKELATTARTVEHPYNPGLMLEFLVSRAALALNAK
ncbi:MAG: DNA polymerase III subunit delta' [Polaromonas sp. 39-63-203]|jgi:DNA polymerase-3 subunit delta'|uniref:DNA polymerase III subunit delta' n=1 Tax=Polaromonas sp. TaxID=1869339 RepID=UPI000BC94B70|nr:DNA polymerase III subunit delta' [Polaromonas sp.]OYY52603.1 MAG: DNA polymerase III subunit delta' [Polaromonas sp. 35-63-240]OYZ01066.1 MAG: DNA polymerase III subunit delta' [Polaromonas sp. 28-63-22]OYZ83920.1 MAG: DNA polymerase III subunit delta' [Polaromonas sp. 24-62-144]OZB01248.1 MAG: DNA polymerase III subunit delta' [Polaromonas sp. 39-63-203]HQS33087.1 DNA polymerase III subunit delta' [Polaromonas sp.]